MSDETEYKNALKKILEFGESLKIITQDEYDALKAEIEKTKKALRDTADGRPSEWAYVQLKNDYDAKCAENERLLATIKKVGKMADDYLAKLKGSP